MRRRCKVGARAKSRRVLRVAAGSAAAARRRCTASDGRDGRTRRATRTTFLRNTLMRVAEFRESLAVLKAAPGEEAEPFTHFLRMETRLFPAPRTRRSRSIRNLWQTSGREAQWEWIGAISAGSAGTPVVAVANGARSAVGYRREFPFPGDHLPKRHCPKALCLSISTTTSRPISCWQERVACA